MEFRMRIYGPERRCYGCGNRERAVSEFSSCLYGAGSPAAGRLMTLIVEVGVELF